MLSRLTFRQALRYRTRAQSTVVTDAAIQDLMNKFNTSTDKAEKDAIWAKMEIAKPAETNLTEADMKVYENEGAHQAKTGGSSFPGYSVMTPSLLASWLGF